jgi:hypoxanthine-DNA glycosylase
MIETHPFGNYVPPNAKYLLLGSFTGNRTEDSFDWYYGTKRNQFWSILESVYWLELRSKLQKQALMSKLHMAISDIIYQCERRDGSNLDDNLVNIVYNTKAISDILDKYPIEKIFFTSRFVETRYKKEFKDLVKRYPRIELVTLPSPSPRYARMSKEQKISRYKELLPIL